MLSFLVEQPTLIEGLDTSRFIFERRRPSTQGYLSSEHDAHKVRFIFINKGETQFFFLSVITQPPPPPRLLQDNKAFHQIITPFVKISVFFLKTNTLTNKPKKKKKNLLCISEHLSEPKTKYPSKHFNREPIFIIPSEAA
jgi:hypothetical protein